MCNEKILGRSAFDIIKSLDEDYKKQFPKVIECMDRAFLHGRTRGYVEYVRQEFHITFSHQNRLLEDLKENLVQRGFIDVKISHRTGDDTRFDLSVSFPT